MIKLSNMELDKVGIIKEFQVDDSIKRRFLDIGIVPDVRIMRVLEDYSHNISAYLVMGGLIAIRNVDTKGIGIIYE